MKMFGILFGSHKTVHVLHYKPNLTVTITRPFNYCEMFMKYEYYVAQMKNNPNESPLSAVLLIQL